MTNADAIKWLENLKKDIGNPAHQSLWHYEQALTEIIDLLADRKTESSLEKPNNCELQTIRCPKCGRTDYIRDMEKDMGIKGSHYKYKCINCNTYIKDEPTISKMEQVDKLQTKDYCDICNHKGCEYCISDSRNPYCIPSNYEPRTEGNE